MNEVPVLVTSMVEFTLDDKEVKVPEGATILDACRREGIAESLYYSWSKEFLEAGKKRLAGDTARQATSNEVKSLRAEARDLKEALAEQMLENRLLKKSMIGDGGDDT